MHTVINAIEKELATKIIAQMDLDEVAKQLAAKFQQALIDSATSEFNEMYELRDFVQETLFDDRTPTGKAFNKAMEAIGKKMVNAIKA